MATATKSKNPAKDAPQSEINKTFEEMTSGMESHEEQHEKDHEYDIEQLAKTAAIRIERKANSVKANPELREKFEALAKQLEKTVPSLAAKAKSEDALIRQIDEEVDKAERYIESIAKEEEKKEKEAEEKNHEKGHKVLPHPGQKPAEKSIEEKAKDKVAAMRAEMQAEAAKAQENGGSETAEAVAAGATAAQEGRIKFSDETIERVRNIKALKEEQNKYLAEAEKAQKAVEEMNMTPEQKGAVRLEELRKEMQSGSAGRNRASAPAASGASKEVTSSDPVQFFHDEQRKQAVQERLDSLRKTTPSAEERRANFKSRQKSTPPAKRGQIRTQVAGVTKPRPTPPLPARGVQTRIIARTQTPSAKTATPPGAGQRRMSGSVSRRTAPISTPLSQSNQIATQLGEVETTIATPVIQRFTPGAISTRIDTRIEGEEPIPQEDEGGGQERAAGGGSSPRRGGLGVGVPKPPNIIRGGLGGGPKSLAPGDLAKFAAKQGAQKGITALITNPWFWLVVAALLLILFVIYLIAGDDSNLKQQQCKGNAATETMKVNVTGPTTANPGQVLTYTITITDTVHNNDDVIAATIPQGISTAQPDITSSWTRFTLTGNTITWKASENGANLTGPPNITFTLTLKAVTASTNAILIVDVTPSRAGGAGGTTIVLDPGHSGTDKSITDPATGLIDHDYPNNPEIDEMWDVVQKVKTKLEADGYKVVLTKNAAGDTVGHRQRADIANNANAALAVSFHDDHSQQWNTFAAVYAQKVGEHRDTAAGKQVPFTNADVATKSQQYATAIQQARAAAEGRAVQDADLNFDGRAGLSPGNISLVQLFSNVPWVYNEVGAGPGAARIPQDEIDKYANGVAAGIEKAVPVTAQAGGGNGCGGTTGGGPANPNYVPPSADNCGGKYKLDNPLGKNFGDPQCNYNKDTVYTELKKDDPQDADVFFNKVIPCESGFNPNAYAGPQTGTPDAKGAWGNYQMGSSTPPGQGADASGTNNMNDRGDVPWMMQEDNAAATANKLNHDLGRYWSCAR